MSNFKDFILKMFGKNNNLNDIEKFKIDELEFFDEDFDAATYFSVYAGYSCK